MKFTLSALTLFLLVFFFSCKKNDDNSGQTKVQLISNTSWKYDTVTFSSIIPIPGSVIPACVKDNTFSFYANNTGVMNEGANQCGTQANPTFSWSFTNNESSIVLSGADLGFLAGTYAIQELSATKFAMSKDTSFSGISAKIILNLKH